MSDTHPINRTLLTILDNQQRRAEVTFEAFPDALWTARPGSDCKPVQEIGQHLLALRCFQLEILGSSRAAEVDGKTLPASPDDLLARLETATRIVREAIEAHDPDDWYLEPETPRDGLWGDEPTIVRFSRPFNDFVNHLGSVRAIRRIAGHGVARTQ